MKTKNWFPFLLLQLAALTGFNQANLHNTGLLHANGATDIIYINGNFSNAASATLTNNGNLYITQTLTNDQTFATTGTGTLYLNGTIAQIVNGSQTFRTNNLNTNNTAGITLNNNLSVINSHVYSNGIITTSSTPNFLVYEAGSSYTGDNDSRHVNGWVKKLGNTAFTFPVGNATWERTIAMQSLSGASEFNAKYFQVTPYPSQLQPPLAVVDPYEYWTLNKVSGGSATVTLNWNYNKVRFPTWVLPDIAVAAYDGSVWTDQGGTASGNIVTTGTITSNTLSSFSLFSFGSKFLPLPLKLLSFSAKDRGDFVALDWQTTSEVDVSHFEVERSYDGVNYNSFATTAARNSGNNEIYSTKDMLPFRNVVYYRLRSIDKDASFSLSPVVAVRRVQQGQAIMLVTNPVNDQIILKAGRDLAATYNYMLMQANGVLVQQGNVILESDRNSTISISANLAKGAYILMLRNGQHTSNLKVIKN